jgi:hypothetical protein
VVFAYGGRESCEMVDRWTQANTVDAYIVLKVFDGYKNCANQPDSWHQYAPARATDSQGTASYTISPGFHLYGEQARLERDLVRWRQDVQAMVASGADWQLVTTFNEWGEGTSVESATEWESPSGYGQYLDVLHTNGQGASTAPAPTLVSKPQRTAADGAGILLTEGPGATSHGNGDHSIAVTLHITQDNDCTNRCAEAAGLATSRRNIEERTRRIR